MQKGLGVGNDEQKLLKLYRSLDQNDRNTLRTFGEFLASRATTTPPRDELEPLEPASTPRPRQESVVGAIKRLSRSYFMLDRSIMLNETSSLMGAHVLQGRPARDVIDDLEALFDRHYAKYREEKEQEKG